jgi:hypothetical protein
MLGERFSIRMSPYRLLWLISGAGADGFRARRRFGAFCGQDFGAVI